MFVFRGSDIDLNKSFHPNPTYKTFFDCTSVQYVSLLDGSLKLTKNSILRTKNRFKLTNDIPSVKVLFVLENEWEEFCSIHLQRKLGTNAFLLKVKWNELYKPWYWDHSQRTLSIISLRTNRERDVFPAQLFLGSRSFLSSICVAIKMILCNKKRKNHKKL